jgi:predicted GIY-YIG superfamily endonuclease
MYKRTTKEVLVAKITLYGGYTKAQLLEWGVPFPPPKGWKTRQVSPVRTKPSPNKRKVERKLLRQQRKSFNQANPKIRFYTLYALRLKQGKYYIGMTSYRDVMRRYEQHATGTGSKWTKLYPPIEIIETRPVGQITESDCASLENQMTMEYMDKYGDRNVRGGALCCVNYETNMKHYNYYSIVKIIKPAENLYIPPQLKIIMGED